jgi:hypothetical protein
MTRHRRLTVRPALLAALVVIVLGAPDDAGAATLQPQTVQAWNTYVASTEARIDRELASAHGFLVADFLPGRDAVRDAVAKGAIPIDRLTSRDGVGKVIAVPDGLIAHWRGAVLLPGVTLNALLERLQNPNERGPHPQDVLALRVLNRRPDQLELAIRMTRTKLVTVTYDTEHVVDYRRFGNTRASSRSVSSRIAEIENAGTPAERALAPGQDRGFLWRMNSYWRYEQVDGGVIVELESLTLSRSIPLGLGIVVDSTIERIARESMHRTLESVRRLYGGTATRLARMP